MDIYSTLAMLGVLQSLRAKAWALFEADPKLEKVLDRTLGQAAIVQMGFQPGVPGTPVFKGRIGMVEFHTYNIRYVPPLQKYANNINWLH